jgi:hypothetical protein
MDAFQISLRCLCHPLALTSQALLILNDSWFTHAFASPLTGKLSDFTGLLSTSSC